MSDIVERLRSAEVFITTGGMVSFVAEEAATEIEKLRAALRGLIAGIEYHGAEKWMPHRVKRARDALGAHQ